MSAGIPVAAAPAARLDIVVVGHVDHGKSTLIGRLLADTHALPEGKLEQVRAMCAKNARPFEYAFLLDALKNEQAQGITIDTARCFFKNGEREYVIHDAPGHVEFLKNMVTGATRAQAALLLIAADEGVQENSKRHGYILSMLGLRQVVVLVNKMDTAGHACERFVAVRDEYGAFLADIGVRPLGFIPVAAREGGNIAKRSAEMAWYDGPTVLEQLAAFQPDTGEAALPFRMPVQDVYKFTAGGDDRRIVAGTVETGRVAVGDEVVFLPSGKRTRIATLERFGGPTPQTAEAGDTAGFTLETQVYVRPGELVVRADEAPALTTPRFRANVFWLGRAPLIKGKRYKLKLGAARVPMELVGVSRVLDASDLRSIEGKQQLDRHDVGECVVEALRPVAYDLAESVAATSRFVIVDGYDVAGFGIVLEDRPAETSLLDEQVARRERLWSRGDVRPAQRADRNGHFGKAVVVAGAAEDGARELARALERRLFAEGRQAYLLAPSDAFDGLDPAAGRGALEREEHLRQLGAIARILTDAGVLFITALTDVTSDELETLRRLSAPNALFVVRVGDGVDVGEEADVALPARPSLETALAAVESALTGLGVIGDYSI